MCKVDRNVARSVIVGVIVWIISVAALWGSLCLAIMCVMMPRWNYDVWGFVAFVGAPLGGVALGVLIVLFGGVLCDLLLYRLGMADELAVLRAGQWRIRMLYVSAIANAACATCVWCGLVAVDVAMTWEWAFRAAIVTQAGVALVGLAVGTWVLGRARSSRAVGVLLTLMIDLCVVSGGTATACWGWRLRDAFEWWILPRGSVVP